MDNYMHTNRDRKIVRPVSSLLALELRNWFLSNGNFILIRKKYTDNSYQKYLFDKKKKV